MTPNDKIAARDALITAASRLFTQKGYEAVSTRELAEAAGVNLAAIQYHFGSKAKLFIETVHSLMQQVGCNHADLLSHPLPKDPHAAAELLCQFVRDYLAFILLSQEPPACRMIFREIHGAASQDQELFPQFIESVVEKFIRPTDDRLLEIVACIAPDLSQTELALTVQSIIGQCVFYGTHQPFVERLRGANPATVSQVKLIGTHIANFTLRAMGFSDQEKLVSKTFDKLSVPNGAKHA